MNELAILATTTVGLAVILLVCVMLFTFILIDIIKEAKISKPSETGRSILSYFKKKDKELD